MLPRAHRLRDAESFRLAGRNGRRRRAATVVTHLWSTGTDGPPRAGLVVSKGVGDAVTRNRVKRRLRHQLRPHLAALPGGSVLVVRALPAAADARSSRLASDLERCLAPDYR